MQKGLDKVEKINTLELCVTQSTKSMHLAKIPLGKSGLCGSPNGMAP